MLRRRRNRRGLALMMVLSLLVLFLLMGVSFLMVASQSEKGARAQAKVERKGTEPSKLLDMAFYQLLREPREENSAVLAHSLLRDMYGEQGFSGQLGINAVPIAGTGKQFIEVTLPAASSNIGNYYAGRVMTFTSGGAKGISVRIVGYDPNNKRFYVTGDIDTAALPREDDWAVVNGPAFSGTGFAFDGSGKLTSEALKPNRRGGTNLSAYLSGGANESYDAVDFQNMALAAVIPDSTAPDGVRVIPSFHRPELIRYSSANADTVLRPVGDAGPNFPAIDLINGPWDVDNDNDGVRDSIWLDLGLPVQPTIDGRRVKPLFAILCVDLDGRLNLNVHGNESHFDPPSLSNLNLAGYKSDPGYDGDDAKLWTPNTKQFRRGFGYGPPEVNLNFAVGAIDHENLLFGAGGIPGRYGHDEKPLPPAPPRGKPGGFGFDPMAQVKFFEHPSNYFAAADPFTATSTFNSPDDLSGWSAMGLNDFGHARYARPNATLVTKKNTPYELSMALDASRGRSETNPADQPFSVAELERLLRANDLDSVALPRRVLDLSANLRNDTTLRKIVTTDSYDVPVVPPVAPGSNVLDQLASLPVDDLLALLPVELLKGSRMDINRPFGDGLDDNSSDTSSPGYGVFDEPNEFARPLRQLYAQQLYVLARVVIGQGIALTPDESREMAKWAVNVVDFRDADSIMTRFAYDANPFDGDWTSDQVVWGCERPELLISETLAWHDRRTYDLEDPNKKVDDTNDPDEHFDQWWVPRGAFFVELYNPWGAGDENRPAEFYYDPSSGSWKDGVILDKVAPGGAPVWRMIIVRGDGRGKDPDKDLSNRPKAERTVYFEQPPVAWQNSSVFFAKAPTLPLNPGAYAVVGSAGIDRDLNGDYRTNLAGWMDTAPNGNTVSSMLPADFKLTDFYSKTDTRQLFFQRFAAPSVHHKFGIINNNFDLDGDWSSRPIGIPIEGLTISEPIGGYLSLVGDVTVNVPTKIDDDLVIHPPLDVPLDLERPNVAPEDIADVEAVTALGTTPHFRMIHLQRLADPTRPHIPNPADPNSNPYLTIDSMSVDLTAFNGVVTRSIARDEIFDGDPVEEKTIHHASLQRGDQEDPANDPIDPNTGNKLYYKRRQLWKYQVHNEDGVRNYPSNAPADAGGHLFAFKIRNSLGSLNSSVSFVDKVPPIDLKDPNLNGGYRPGINNTYLGFPEIYNDRSVVPATLNGLPPFPLLTWNNRPFVSQYELMLVPKSRSSRLLHDYSIDKTRPVDPYDPYDSVGGTVEFFGHLPNYFNINGPRPQIQWHRILDYTQVPSRFVGTETVMNWKPFESWSDRLNLYSFPNNKVATFREPGKVNLNTIFDPRVWQALMDGDNVSGGHGGPTFGEFVASRRGYNEGNIGGTPADILLTNASFPTHFANPFRSIGAGKLVPPLVPPPSPLPTMEREDIQCTLMRDFPNAHPDPNKRKRPMFELTRQADFEYMHLDNRRNPVMRNHALTRIANLVTSRSNVYAIWITVGYFEVDEATGQLGAEKGSDTGEISRHRAFYMVDRSIPVAYERGENHNVDRCVLVRRFIE